MRDVISPFWFGWLWSLPPAAQCPPLSLVLRLTMVDCGVMKHKEKARRSAPILRHMHWRARRWKTGRRPTLGGTRCAGMLPCHASTGHTDLQLAGY